jgi:4-amino-4-deoxy-L-arabinose transferase-like glycosyltransferase
MIKKLSRDQASYIFLTVVVLIILRLILLSTFPLLDKTETRYSDIARIMGETNEWIVLQIDYGIPFWAKPPLSTWLSAIGIAIFGATEFAVRLPSFLLNLFLIFILGKYVTNKKHFFLLAFILLTTLEFYLHTGVVSTDTALCFSIVLIMISFWKGFHSESYVVWKHLFFAGIALGFLSKGPLVLVLTGPPILAWLIIQKVKLSVLLKRLPWISGLILCLLITLPWYIVMEQRSPGFIDYFIVGEHFKRFLVSGWTGDLYGSGHQQPLGMIWLFLMLFAFPWIQIVLVNIFKKRKDILSNSWVCFLVFWLIWTPLFFTISKNILHTYILPVMIPMALLMVYWWNDFKNKKLILGVATIIPVFILIGFMVLTFYPSSYKALNTDKHLILNSTHEQLPVFYYKNITFSSKFYTSGQVKPLHSEKQLDSLIEVKDKFLLLVPNKYKSQLEKTAAKDFEVKDSTYKTSVYIIQK